LVVQVMAVDQAVSALAVSGRQPVDLLVTDIVMPGGVGGVEWGRVVQEWYPLLKVMLTSGFPTARMIGTESHSFRFLGEPHNRRELADEIGAQIEHFAAGPRHHRPEGGPLGLSWDGHLGRG
jgi:DNA-binding NtrC family response regulator